MKKYWYTSLLAFSLLISAIASTLPASVYGTDRIGGMAESELRVFGQIQYEDVAGQASGDGRRLSHPIDR